MSIFIIGEIGINHNGDINLAKKLITEAKKAGVDAVKFQKRTIELVYTKENHQSKASGALFFQNLFLLKSHLQFQYFHST